MIVTASIPVPVRHVPPRARAQKLSWVAREVPVEIPEVRDGAFDRLRIEGALPVFWNGDHALHLRGGVAYRRLVGTGGVPLRPDAFAGWLARDVESFLFDREFSRSSLVLGDNKGWRDRGASPGSIRLGSVVEDGGTLASARGARFLGEEILVDGDAVYRRYRPLAGAPGGLKASIAASPSARVELGNDPRHAFSYYVRADRIAESQIALAGELPTPDSLLRRLFAELPATAYGDDDLPEIAAGSAAAAAESLRAIGVARRRRGLRPAEGEEEALARLEERGFLWMAGGPEGDELRRAIEEVRAAIGFACAETRVEVPGREVLRRLDAYLAGFVIPRVEAAWEGAPDRDEDLRELSRLGR